MYLTLNNQILHLREYILVYFSTFPVEPETESNSKKLLVIDLLIGEWEKSGRKPG